MTGQQNGWCVTSSMQQFRDGVVLRMCCGLTFTLFVRLFDKHYVATISLNLDLNFNSFLIFLFAGPSLNREHHRVLWWGVIWLRKTFVWEAINSQTLQAYTYTLLVHLLKFKVIYWLTTGMCDFKLSWLAKKVRLNSGEFFGVKVLNLYKQKYTF